MSLFSYILTKKRLIFSNQPLFHSIEKCSIYMYRILLKIRLYIQIIFCNFIYYLFLPFILFDIFYRHRKEFLFHSHFFCKKISCLFCNIFL